MNAAQVVRTTVLVFGGQIAARLLDLGAMLVIARSFGEVGFGRFSFAVAYVGYFAVLTDLGFNVIFVRELARSPERAADLLTGVLTLRLALILIGMGLALIGIRLPGYPAETSQLVQMMTVALLISPKLPSLRVVYEQLFQVRLQMGVPTLLKLLDGGLFIGLVYGLVRSAQPLQAVMIAYVASTLPGLIILLWASRRFVTPAPRFDCPLMARLLRQALPVALLVAFTTLSYRIDVLFLSLWRGDVEVGYYSAAYRLTESLRLIPGAVITALYPVMAAAYGRASEPLAPGLIAGLKSLLIVIIPICIGMIFYADRLIHLLYTPSFAPAGTALTILIWAELCFFINCPLSYALLAVDRQETVIRIAFLMLATNLMVNAVLIPQWGYRGASATTVITEGVGTLCYGIAARRLLGSAVWRVILPLLPGVGVILAWLLMTRSLPLPVVLAGAMLVYPLSLRLTGGVTGGEWTMLRTALIGRSATRGNPGDPSDA